MEPEWGLIVHGRFNSATASRHYRQLDLASRVSEASPHALVALLYQELMTSLDAMISMTNNGGSTSASAHLGKACSILVALEASLDFDKGGDLAAVLARIYRSARWEMDESARNNDSEKLSELRAAMSDIVYAWTALTAV